MNCIICRQIEIVDGLTSVTFERDEFRLAFNNVPARVCPNCGEAYMEEEIAVRLLREAEDMSTQGMMDNVVEYVQVRN